MTDDGVPAERLAAARRKRGFSFFLGEDQGEPAPRRHEPAPPKVRGPPIAKAVPPMRASTPRDCADCGWDAVPANLEWNPDTRRWLCKPCHKREARPS